MATTSVVSWLPSERVVAVPSSRSGLAASPSAATSTLPLAGRSEPISTKWTALVALKSSAAIPSSVFASAAVLGVGDGVAEGVGDWLVAAGAGGVS